MNKRVLYNILTDLALKYQLHNAKKLNDVLGTKKGKHIMSGAADKIEDSEYIEFISKLIYRGLFR